MKKTETAVYMLIAIVLILGVILVAKPVIVGKDGVATQQIKLLNFKKLA